MHLLVTRPEPAAARLAARLEASGHSVTRAPLLEIRPLPAAPDLAGVQALVFTSSNGVHAFAALTRARDLPVYAVGEATAAAARSHGFRDVRAAGGDVNALAALIAAGADPGGGPLLHASGRDAAGDLAGMLGRAGIALRRQRVYEARAEPCLPEAAARALAGEPWPLDGVLFFSPRTALLFETLTAAAGLSRHLAGVTAWCLSAAVAANLTPDLWRDVAVAAAPDQASLLALLPAGHRTQA